MSGDSVVSTGAVTSGETRMQHGSQVTAEKQLARGCGVGAGLETTRGVEAADKHWERGKGPLQRGGSGGRCPLPSEVAAHVSVTPLGGTVGGAEERWGSELGPSAWLGSSLGYISRDQGLGSGPAGGAGAGGLPTHCFVSPAFLTPVLTSPLILVPPLMPPCAHREPLELLPDQGGDCGEAGDALRGPGGRCPCGYGPPLRLQRYDLLLHAPGWHLLPLGHR